MSDHASDAVPLLLFPGDQRLIHEEVIWVSEDLERKLSLGEIVGECVVFQLTMDELDELAECLAAAANHCPDRRRERELEALYDRVTALLGVPRITVDRPSPRGLFLTPEQQMALMDSWDGEEAAVRLNADLTLDDLTGAPFFHNARGFLRAVLNEGSVKATVASNLNRAFVVRMTEELAFDSFLVQCLNERGKAYNEQDARPLHVLRVVCQVAGLLLRRSGKFTVTKRGQQLLADERAGALYEHLFRIFFRKFNLAYLDGHPAGDGFQRTVGFSLFVLAQDAAYLRATGNPWQRPEEFAQRLLHPLVLEELEKMPFRPHANILIETRFLAPLSGFGLVERREGSKYPEVEYRALPLLDRFISFHIGPAEPLGWA